MEETEKKESERIHRKRKFLEVLLWTCVALFVASLLGFLASLVLLALGVGGHALGTSLCGGFLGGIVLFGGASMVLFRTGDKLSVRELDALEREDDPNSFFVGEGTLVTFRDDGLSLHGGEKIKPVTIPYRELKFYAVCERKAPREQGKPSVLIEIPAYYLNRKEERRDTTALVQTDGKERLYRRIAELDLELSGEKPSSGEGNREFSLLKSFVLPDKRARKKMIVLIIISAILIAGGIVTATVLPGKLADADALAYGGVAILMGLYFGVHGLFALRSAKTVFGVYREGIYFRNHDGVDRLFLKWEEVRSLETFERDQERYLKVKCLYGDYDFPRLEGAFEYIAEQFPEKIEKNEA